VNTATEPKGCYKRQIDSGSRGKEREKKKKGKENGRREEKERTEEKGRQM